MSEQSPFARLIEPYKMNLVEKKKIQSWVGRNGRVERVAVGEFRGRVNMFKIHYMKLSMSILIGLERWPHG